MSYVLQDKDDHELTFDSNSMKEVARYLNLKVNFQLRECRERLEYARKSLEDDEYVSDDQNAIPTSHSLAPEARRVIESIQELERVVTGLVRKAAMGHGIEEEEV